MITVVIPYFQRSPGILAKALASIAAQEGCPLPIQVIVVDDASPAPVAAELVGVGAMPHPVRVITQANGGPGAARNTGLDHAPPGTRYLAFLDSDDEWMPDHLARAVAALECGYDFFFADHYQLDQAIGAFARGGRLELERHPSLPTVQADLHAYAGDLLDQTIRGNLIGTSTVVYNFTRFAAQRFQVEFANAGEDYLFWMALMVQGASSAFSTHTAARYGKGVNIYAGAGWGSEQHLLRTHNEIKYRQTILRLFKLTSAQRQHVQAGIQNLRHAVARDLLHRVSHRKALPWSLLRAHFKLDPWSFGGLPAAALKILWSRGK